MSLPGEEGIPEKYMHNAKAMKGHSEVAIRGARRETSGETHFADTLILNFRLHNCEKIDFCFLSHPLAFVTASREDSHGQCGAWTSEPCPVRVRTTGHVYPVVLEVWPQDLQDQRHLRTC